MRKNKLRIAFFGDDFSRKGRGTALVIRKIAQTLLTFHSEEVKIILLRPEGHCEGPVCARAKSVIIRKRFSTLFSYLWFFISHRERYDAVIFNRVVYPGFWFLRAKTFVLFQHDASCSEIYEAPRTGANLAFEFFLRFVGQYFLDAVIGVSKDARNWIARYFRIPESKVFALYLAAGEEYARYDERTHARCRERIAARYGIRSPYILDVSRFDPHKNIERVLGAFFALKEHDKIRHTLVLVGGPHTRGYSEEIMQRINASPYAEDVLVLPYVEAEDMPALYNCADLLVYPSLVEGFGLPLIEAMSAGIPVVTSSVSCLPEIADDAAELVDPRDERAIAAAVRALMEHSSMRDDLVRRGSRRAADFSWRKSADSFLALLRASARDARDTEDSGAGA